MHKDHPSSTITHHWGTVLCYVFLCGIEVQQLLEDSVSCFLASRLQLWSFCVSFLLHFLAIQYGFTNDTDQRLFSVWRVEGVRGIDHDGLVRLD
jgi:hypothetical protein